MTRKRCNNCRRMKPLHEFHLNRKCKDGRQSSCKRCSSLYSKEKHRRKTDKRGGSWCHACAGMPHRVVGTECAECGLARGSLPPVKLDADVLRSNAGALEVS